MPLEQNTMNWLAIVVPPVITLLGVAIASFVTLRSTKKSIKASQAQLLSQLRNSRRQKLVDDLQPILSTIIDDLHILQRAFCFKGKFCPPIEAQCPTLSQYDNGGDSMSYASRTYQFSDVGYRISRSCRQILFLTNEKDIKGILTCCRELKAYLMSSDPGKKSNLEFLMCILADHLSSENRDLQHNASDGNQLKTAASILREFLIRLEDLSEKELPVLAEKLYHSMAHLPVEPNN